MLKLFELSDLQEKLEHKEGQLADANAQNEALKDEVDAAKAKLANKMAELVQYVSRVEKTAILAAESVRFQLSDAQNETLTLEEALTAMTPEAKAELNMMKLDMLKNMQDEMEHKIEQLKEDYANEMSNGQIELDSQAALRNDLKTKCTDLETKCDDLEIKCTDLETKCDDLEINCNDLETKVEDATQRWRGERKRVSVVEAERDTALEEYCGARGHLLANADCCKPGGMVRAEEILRKMSKHYCPDRAEAMRTHILRDSMIGSQPIYDSESFAGDTMIQIDLETFAGDLETFAGDTTIRNNYDSD